MEHAKRLSLWIFYGLLAYMPMHIFLSTWLGTSFNILPWAKVAKDIVLVFGFILVLAASVRQTWFRPLLKNKLLWLILAYTSLTVLLALLKPTDQDAEILGVIYNTRFLLFFLYGVLLSHLFEPKQLIQKSVMVVVAAATVVLFFGIIQYTVLPNDALTHVGYSRANGVLPAFFIDEKPDLERAMSTLRDPNSFGSYVIITGMIGLALLLKTKKQNLKYTGAGLLTLSLLCLWFTFSRSAWIGFVLAAAVALVLSMDRHKLTPKVVRYMGMLVAAVIIIAGAMFFALRNTYFVQNVIFHADESTVLEDPNQLRTRFWRESLEAVGNNPLGYGPGTAGLASIRNETQGTTLNENYYLQIAYEVGIVGLVLLLSIIMFVGAKLLLRKDDWLTLGLFASFIGLAFTNFLVHIWSNEAVAYTWWGLAALAFAKSLLPKKS